jgi:hypothetical protein
MELGDRPRAVSAGFPCQIAQYNGATRVARYRALTGKVENNGGSWECCLKATSVPNRPDAIDVIASFRVTKGRAGQVSVGLCVVFEQWSAEHYVCMPAAVDAGNRFASKPLAYPPMLPMVDRGPSEPQIITDVPRLNVGSSSSRIQHLTRDLATPAAGVYDPKTQRGFWLLTHFKTRLGDSGIDLQENDDRSQATLCIEAPGVREDFRYAKSSISRISEDRGADFAEGDSDEFTPAGYFVIAISFILAAFLFPVFAQARDGARQASCSSNKKLKGANLLGACRTPIRSFRQPVTARILLAVHVMDGRTVLLRMFRVPAYRTEMSRRFILSRPILMASTNRGMTCGMPAE